MPSLPRSLASAFSKGRFTFCLTQSSLFPYLSKHAITSAVCHCCRFLLVSRICFINADHLSNILKHGSKKTLGHCGPEHPRIQTYVLGLLLVHLPIHSFIHTTLSITCSALLRSHSPLRSFFRLLAYLLSSLGERGVCFGFWISYSFEP